MRKFEPINKRDNKDSSCTLFERGDNSSDMVSYAYTFAINHIPSSASWLDMIERRALNV